MVPFLHDDINNLRGEGLVSKAELPLPVDDGGEREAGALGASELAQQLPLALVTVHLLVLVWKADRKRTLVNRKVSLTQL